MKSFDYCPLCGKKKKLYNPYLSFVCCLSCFKERQV